MRSRHTGEILSRLRFRLRRARAARRGAHFYLKQPDTTCFPIVRFTRDPKPFPAATNASSNTPATPWSSPPAYSRYDSEYGYTPQCTSTSPPASPADGHADTVAVWWIRSPRLSAQRAQAKPACRRPAVGSPEPTRFAWRCWRIITRRSRRVDSSRPPRATAVVSASISGCAAHTAATAPSPSPPEPTSPDQDAPARLRPNLSATGSAWPAERRWARGDARARPETARTQIEVHA